MTTARQIKNQKGFTLIELLVVIGILAVLLAITLIAINPARQFQQANDTKRKSDVNAILNAVDQYAADNSGQLPAAITSTATDIGNGSGQIDLCAALITKYLAAMPMDPTTGTVAGANAGGSFNCQATGSPATVPTYDSHYQISKSANDNRVTVSATPEILTSISVTR